MARNIAKSLVKNGFCNRCHIQLSYFAGNDQPLIYVDSFNSCLIPNMEDSELEKLIAKEFDLDADKLVNILDLKRPNFKKTAINGHFVKHEGQGYYPWERVKDLMHCNPNPPISKKDTLKKNEGRRKKISFNEN